MSAGGTAAAGLAIAAVAATLAACGEGPTSPILPGADAERGQELIERFGCGTCHTIGGIDAADGDVGPDLRNYEDGRFIAGSIAKTPENTVRWIMDPRSFEPDTIMPDLGVSQAEARDIVQYLYGQ